MMKGVFKSYTSFTRTEKLGLAVLTAILIVLLAVRMSLHFWVKPSMDEAQQQKFSAAWADFKKQHTVSDSTGDAEGNKQDLPAGVMIDLNTADSASLTELKGIGPVTAHKIIEWRKDKGPFKSVDELLEVRHFPKDVFEELKGHLRVR